MTKLQDRSVMYEEGFQPGFLGQMTQLHGEYYSKLWGVDSRFEAMQAREMCDLCDRYDPEKDLLLTAHLEGTLIGSIAIDGSQWERPGLARLRWYFVDENYRGLGIGNQLIRQGITFCRLKKYPVVFLWTVEELPEALHLYQKFGFRTKERFEDTTYTIVQTQLMMELELKDFCKEGE